MKLTHLLMTAAAVNLLAGCAPEENQSANKDIVTDIDGSDEARTAPYIYYVDADQVVRGECSTDAAFTRAQCQTNVKSMSEEVFRKRVSLEVTREHARIESGMKASEGKIAAAKDEANALLVKNHGLQKSADEKSAEISVNSARIASKDTDLTGLTEQLKATDDALAANPGADEKQQLLAIKASLTTKITSVKKDRDLLLTAATKLDSELAALKTQMAANSTQIDSLIAVQNDETVRLGDYAKELVTVEADLSEIESTFKLLKADLIPYEINNASTGFVKNKRWIKRFDLVMNGQIATNEVRIGSPDAFTGTFNLNAGYLLLKVVTVTQKMDIRKLGVISNTPVPEAVLSIFNVSDKKLVTSTAVFPMVTGVNEIDVSAFTTIEPGSYYIGIQGNTSLTIRAGSNTSTYNYYTQNSFPQLPDTLTGTTSTDARNLNLYIIGDTY
jgi:hypothetical protein